MVTKLICIYLRDKYSSFLPLSNARDELQGQLQVAEEAKAALERESDAKISTLEQQVASLSASLSQLEAEAQTTTEKISTLE